MFFHMLQPNSVHIGENKDDPEDFKVVTHFQTNRSFLVLADPFGPAELRLRFGGCAHGVHGASPG